MDKLHKYINDNVEEVSDNEWWRTLSNLTSPYAFNMVLRPNLIKPIRIYVDAKTDMVLSPKELYEAQQDLTEYFKGR